MRILRQSTAVVIPFGPFVDKADGITLKTALVSALDNASTGIMLSKTGGTLAVRHATVTASVYDAYGCYKVTLDTTDTNTLGTLRVIYTDATTCLPVWADFTVVTANFFDSLCSTDLFDVSVTQWNGSAVATPATAGYPVVTNKVGTGTGELDLNSGVIEANLAQILGTALTETAGYLAAAFKKFFNVGSPTGTVNSLPDALAGASGGMALVGSAMNLTSAYDAAKTAAPETGGNIAAIKAKTDNLPTDPASNTQINTRLATSGYTTPDNAGISAIKAKTDNLPAAPAIEGNVQGHVADALAAYDPPTRAEATADKAAILAAVAALNDMSVGEILSGDLSDNLNFPANSLADLVRKLFWVICNRLVITDATGAFTAYKTDGVTLAAAGTITNNGATTARSKPTWP